MPRRKLQTFCRICEPSCGLVAEVENERIVKLRPDVDHPVTRGFACHKGLGFDAVHADPDRLDVPLARSGARGAGVFEPVGWDAAIADIAARLQQIRERHGGDAIAGYFGNPSAFNATAVPAMGSLLRQLGSRRLFNSGTQDCANKFAGAEAVFGTSTLHPVPDFEHTRYALIFGENPAVSRMSFVSIADPMAALRAARRRGASIRFVNPRRIESATAATGDVLQIKPDTDLYFMAALLHEIDAAGLFREDLIAAHGKHVEGLRAFIAPYSAQAVSAVVGIDAQTIRSVALEFACASGACVHMSTGVNMGRQGTLCYWLLQMLSFVTGNLDRRGGNLYAAGFYPATRAGRLDPEAPVFRDSAFGPLREIRGALPGNLLADLIETDGQPIRALIVMAGNPLLSIGGEARLRRAFERLELLVVVDLFRNATGELADYLLPSTDMLERRDVNLCGLGMQSQPFVQYSEAVVPARGQRREEWWIFGRLEQALGLASPFDRDESPDALARLDRMLGHAQLSVEKLRTLPAQTAVLPPPAPGRFYSDWIQTPDHRVDCCPPLFASALERAHRIFEELRAEPAGVLKLINLRTPYMQNSWFHNVAALKRPHQRHNPLHVAPADARARGLHEGDAVQVSSAHGCVDATVRIDETLREGVVAMTHGWGHERAPGLRVARQYPGVNVNALLPSGPGSYEPLSNQAHMTGISVELLRP
jgi:anaerobic selenocysteine-containing dehydrogenase